MIVIGAAVAGTTFSIVQSWHNAQVKIMQDRHAFQREQDKRVHDEEKKEIIKNYEEKLRNLENLLVRPNPELGRNEYFDVKQLCEGDITKLGPSMQAYGQARFYVSDRVKENNIWEHRLGNAAEFVDEISGGRNKLVSVLKNLSSGKPNTGQLSNIYIWKGTNEVLVESDAPVKRLFPYITVTSFSNNDVFKRIDELYTHWFSLLRSTVRRNSSIRLLIELLLPRFMTLVNQLEEDTRKSAKIVLENDLPGFILTGNLVMDLSYPVLYPEIKYDLKKLQKIGKVYYRRSVGLMKDIKVIGKAGIHTYDVIDEVFLIHTANNSYVIHTIVPVI
jgi:hypothetical protein